MCDCLFIALYSYNLEGSGLYVVVKTCYYKLNNENFMKVIEGFLKDDDLS